MDKTTEPDTPDDDGVLPVLRVVRNDGLVPHMHAVYVMDSPFPAWVNDAQADAIEALNAKADEAAELRAEVERLRVALDVVVEVELARARKAVGSPHPMAFRVEDTDGRPTWELPGRFVRELDPNEWEAHITTAITGSPFQVVSQNASPFHVYRVRRVAPPEPQMALRTVPVGTVELGSLTPSGKPIDGVERSKRFPYGAILVDGQWHPTVNGTVTIQANGGES